MPGPAPAVLHLLSQRPTLTGSGITLDALVRHAAESWDQWVVVGTPQDDPQPLVATIGAERVRPLVFGQPPLDFPVPGMSDVMPYESTRFGAMSPEKLDAYRTSWRRHLQSAAERVRPAIVHTHHLWLMSAMVKEVFPNTPVVLHCHATGLRQLALCEHLAAEVRAGCSHCDRFVVLHGAHAELLSQTLGVASDRVRVVGAGYRDELFHSRGRAAAADGSRRLVFVGKFSAAKGLPWLLDAVEQLTPRFPELELHVAGGGAGQEAEQLHQRMRDMAPTVVLHGRLTQPELADLLRRCAVCVLPSLYEGVPLVLAEARACGCRVVATRLPGVEAELAGPLGDALHMVTPPGLLAPDQPDPADLPGFVARLVSSLGQALTLPAPAAASDGLAELSWRAVFGRVEAVWRELTE